MIEKKKHSERDYIDDFGIAAKWVNALNSMGECCRYFGMSLNKYNF